MMTQTNYEPVTTMTEDNDDSGWAELISDLDNDYLEAFRDGNDEAIQDAAIELSAFGYDSDHLEALQSIVFKEVGAYMTYLEMPELYEDNEIPPEPDVHPGFYYYFNLAEE